VDVALREFRFGSNGAEHRGLGLEAKLDARCVPGAHGERLFERLEAKQPRADGCAARGNGGDEESARRVGDRTARGADKGHARAPRGSDVAASTTRPAMTPIVSRR